ncbi:hypothetical protein [Salinarchaeum laminariae]|uniref:hypothetical protein n=1 Tax=Salinarchaeum laminariae TaxID=869888 RepID=UPI0020BEB660|nr:hypothetical protein [Salinarchaeum laminariae]
MSEPVDVAVPRKGRPLEAVLGRLADRAGDASAAPGADADATDEYVESDDAPTVAAVADDVISTLRYEKQITKDDASADDTVYERLAEYSDLDAPYRPEFTLLRDDRAGRPRRIVFDAMTLWIDGVAIRLVGREEPFRAVRTHEVPLAFDSADLVLEEVVELRPEPLTTIEDLNARIDPQDTDVRVATGLGDTVYHTLLGTPEQRHAEADQPVDLDREFVAKYEGPLCVSPRYERLVAAVLGTDAIDGVEFVHPENGREEEAAIADAGLGVYLTVTGSTARDHGLDLGTKLFPSETVLMENVVETDSPEAAVRSLIAGEDIETALSAS